MAKIFWIAEKDGDSMEMWAFNNQRKANDKAMELSSDFSFGSTEVAKDGNEDGDAFFYSGTIDAKDCFLLYRKDGTPHAEGFGSEDEAREEYPGDGAGACFPVKLKGGMGSVYMSTEAEGDGTELWIFEDGDIYENKNTKTSKYVPTFESFLASQKVNEAKASKGLKKLLKKRNVKLNEAYEDTECDIAQKEKWGPVCKLLKCDYYDLVFFELIHSELGEYTDEEYAYAEEKDEKLDFNIKKYKIDAINDEDPHGRCEGAIVGIKGTKLKYASFDAPDMSYSGTIASSKDLQALEDFYLDGYEGKRSKAIQYATPMYDVYGEYCMDMGFEDEDED